MPNYVRWKEKGASYFFTVVTYRRRPIFRDANARRLLGRAMASTRRERPFDMFACVLLPDHLHCIWTMPEDDDNFSDRWGIIKSRFTKSFLDEGGIALPVTENRKKRCERGVWQPRFWEHRIRDEDNWYRLRDYIHLNPVKHALVAFPEDWEWSSFHRHVRLGWLDPHWPGVKGVEMPASFGE